MPRKHHDKLGAKRKPAGQITARNEEERRNEGVIWFGEVLD
jgi:hypothetical protein